MAFIKPLHPKDSPEHKKEQKLNKQMYFHHWAGIMMIFSGMAHGYGGVFVLSAGCCMEISSIYLNLRSFYTRKEMKEHCSAKVVNGLFAIAFLIFRMILIPYILYLTYKELSFSWGHIPAWRNWAMIPAVIVFFGLYLLNIFWFKIIMKGFLVMLGCIKPK